MGSRVCSWKADLSVAVDGETGRRHCFAAVVGAMAATSVTPHSSLQSSETRRHETKRGSERRDPRASGALVKRVPDDDE